ncbi:Afadin and alpha-actinin-binding-domain-containing protein [Scenedesmus sp. NREL 46B-D3]|nr:Afadin and alpha-actinin-binding-domain-containing protein [Scenedesmus sp. NREL 46B-D3]
MPFANLENLESSCRYLEPVLQDLGLKQWQLQGGTTVALANTVYELVQRQQGLLVSKEQLQDELQKLKVDVKTADKTIQRLQCQSDQKAQEAGGLNIKLRQLDTWYRDETERWGAERDQLAKKCAQLEQRHVQFQHELRRKDTEFEKLQKQLTARLGAAAGAGGGSGRRSMGRSGSSSSSSMQVTGKLTTTGRNGTVSSRNAAATVSTDTRRATKAELEEIHKRVVEAYEADKQELQQDNAALRKVLHDLQREHVDLLNGCHPAAAPSATAAAATTAGLKGLGSSPAAAAVLGPNPIAALQQMQNKLEALRVRKQRITGGGCTADLHQLQQHAQSASERLLLVKLLEASNIMEEQEAALVMAMKALPIAGHA